MGNPIHKERAWASLAILISLVLVSAAVVVPGQPEVWLGVEIGAIALFWAIRAIRILRQFGEDLRQAQPPASTWRVEWATLFAWLIALIAGVIVLVIGSGAGLYLVAIAVVGMFGFAAWGAWVLISEVGE
jgi:hypothetical protein